MKKYRVRYNILLDYVVDVVADSPEKAKELIRNIGNNEEYKPEVTYSDGECFNFLTEIDESGEDIEGSDFY
jgi:hypothetical protein